MIVDGENFCDNCGFPGPTHYINEDGLEICTFCQEDIEKKNESLN